MTKCVLTLRGYYAQFIDMARQNGVGVLLESTTWVANLDRGATIGCSPETLKELNIAAIDLIPGRSRRDC